MSRPPYWSPKTIPNQSDGSRTFFLCKNFFCSNKLHSCWPCVWKRLCFCPMLSFFFSHERFHFLKELLFAKNNEIQAFEEYKTIHYLQGLRLLIVLMPQYLRQIFFQYCIHAAVPIYFLTLLLHYIIKKIFLMNNKPRPETIGIILHILLSLFFFAGDATQQSFIREGFTPRSNPLSFFQPFFEQTSYPFSIPSIDKR